MKYQAILVITLIFQCLVSAQDIPVSIKNEALYQFVDELAACRMIQVNQAVKPYSQKQVSEWLDEAASHYAEMTQRQKEEWLFYKDNIVWHSGELDLFSRENGAFSLTPLGVFSTSEKMTFSLKPILNAKFMMNSNGVIYHRSYGAELNLTVGNWGFYGNLQDYAENEPFSQETFLMNMPGGNYKGTDYSDMRGGVTYANDWVSLGLVKDYVEWGTNENGANIISDRAPSFTQLKLKIKPVEWFEFNYMHGFLVSNVIDSAESYVMDNGNRRDVMHGKYIATNLLTLYPFKSLALSFGNSIVYSADNVKVQYLNPFMFYKSVDHTYNSTDGAGQNVGQNSQMFLDLGFRGIDHVFLYYTLFIDELKMERWKHKDEYNFYSYKVGAKITQLIPNASFGFEYTHTTPMTYTHHVTTTTFESNDYNMGHYLRSNAAEYHGYVHYRPLKNLRFKLSYTQVLKGEEYDYVLYDPELVKRPFIDEVRYKSTVLEFMTEYQIAYDMFFNLSVGYSNTSGEDLDLYMPPHFRGEQFNVMIGANIGF